LEPDIAHTSVVRRALLLALTAHLLRERLTEVPRGPELPVLGA
jgi:hypothetical protein